MYPDRMASPGDLLTLDELRRWTRKEIEDADQATYAEWVITTVSNGVRFYGDSNWTVETAPPRALDIASIVARRGYLNPNQEVRTGAIGPLGGVGYDKEGFGAGIAFTASEIDDLERLAEEGGGGRAGSRLWVQAIEHPHPLDRTTSTDIPVTVQGMPTEYEMPMFNADDPIVKAGRDGS